MSKILEGVVVSLGTPKTAVVEVTRIVRHPFYKKLMRKSKRIKADTQALKIAMGDFVKIVETRPISREKHFKIMEVKNDST